MIYMPTSQTVKVWDLPVRLLHWSIVVCFVVSWATAAWFDNTMQIHLYSGYTLLVLVLFRIAWGFVGSSTARFSHFVSGVRPVIIYASTLLQPRASHHHGHNPLGGWVVLAMLSLLLLQAITGLFSNDDLLTTGPLAHWVSDDVSDIFSNIHSIAFYVLLAIVGLHITAVLFYRFFKHENLITAMVTGNKTLPHDMPAHAIHLSSNWRAFILLILIAGGVIAMVMYNN